MSHDAPCALDDTGRTTFSLYFPATEFWYGISAFRGGPTIETRRYVSVPGTVLPEETIGLPRTCDLAASIRDPKGKAYKEHLLYVRVVYEDGSEQSLAIQTDKRGLLSEKSSVRATAFVLEVRSADSKARWKSQRLDGSAVEVLDLGEIVLDGGDD